MRVISTSDFRNDLVSLSAAQISAVARDDRLMLIREAKTSLVAMLAEAGVSPGAVTAADVRTIVEAYRCFAAIPAEDAASIGEDGDAVLAQFGTHDFRGVPEFSADLTRQLLAVGQVDPPMWQLSCTLHWDPNPETTALASGDLWSFGMTLDEFFGEVAALPGWAWALTGSQAPRDLAITFEEV